MKKVEPYFANLDKETAQNEAFRDFAYTDSNLQLVYMSIDPLDEIGMESHSTTQVFLIREGECMIKVNNKTSILYPGSIFIVPGNTLHNVINISETKTLKLATIYAPPEHL